MQCRRSRSDPLMMPRNHLGFAPRLISPPPPTAAVTHLFSPSTHQSTLIWLTASQHVSRTVQTSIAFNPTSKRRGVHVQVHTSRGDEPVYTACLSPLCPPSVKPFTSAAFDRRRSTQTLPPRFSFELGFLCKKRSNNIIKVNSANYKVFWNLLWMNWTHYE